MVYRYVLSLVTNRPICSYHPLLCYSYCEWWDWNVEIVHPHKLIIGFRGCGQYQCELAFCWGDVFAFPHSSYLELTEQGYRGHISGLYVMVFSHEAHTKSSICIRKLTNYSCNSCTEHPIHFQSEQEESQWIAYPSSYDSHMRVTWQSHANKVCIHRSYIWLNLPLFGKVFVGDVLSPVVLMTSMVFLLAVGGESDSLVSWWGGLVDLLDTSE